MHVAAVQVELLPLRRADAAHAEAHGRQALQVRPLREVLLEVGPPLRTPEEALRRGRRRRGQGGLGAGGAGLASVPADVTLPFANLGSSAREHSFGARTRVSIQVLDSAKLKM